MRTQIATALKRRSKAIHNAIDKYNAAAAALGKPLMEWSRISSHQFMEDFTILKDSSPHVLDKPWSQPIIWLAMKQHQKVVRAREQMERSIIEIRRLHTHC